MIEFRYVQKMLIIYFIRLEKMSKQTIRKGYIFTDRQELIQGKYCRVIDTVRNTRLSLNMFVMIRLGCIKFLTIS